MAHRLAEAIHCVLFMTAYHLLRELLTAKRNIDLPMRQRMLSMLGEFIFLLPDDLGCLLQRVKEFWVAPKGP